MKKTVFFIFTFLFSALTLQAADSNLRHFKSNGQVVTVDPVYSQITIFHGAIKDFAGDGATEFYASDPELLKNIQKNDLVDFEFTDTKGDVKIDKITKTGVASPEKETPFGTAVQETLEGAGNIVKGVTEPIAPVHEVTSGVADATTNATGSVLRDVPSEQKSKF